MRKLKIIAFLLIIANSFWSCEKDDICAEGTPTTPRLVIDFFDAANPTQPKNVTQLKAIATGASSDLIFNGVSRITLPLKTNATTTSWELTLNGADSDPANDNTDIILCSYQTQDIYISRACGYKTVFELDNTTALQPDTNLWISALNLVQPSIQNENETHLKIYF